MDTMKTMRSIWGIIAAACLTVALTGAYWHIGTFAVASLMAAVCRPEDEEEDRKQTN